MKKVLCFTCRQWSLNSEICEHCGNVLSRELRKQQDEVEELKRNPPAPPKPPHQLKRAFDYLQSTRNPLLKVIYYLLISVWMVYVGIMLIFMYLIAFSAG